MIVLEMSVLSCGSESRSKAFERPIVSLSDSLTVAVRCWWGRLDCYCAVVGAVGADLVVEAIY